MHLFHGLGRIWQLVANFALEPLLVTNVRQHILAIVKDLGIRIEQHAVQFALPCVKPFDRRQEFFRVPVGIFRIF